MLYNINNNNYDYIMLAMLERATTLSVHNTRCDLVNPLRGVRPIKQQSRLRRLF